MNNDPQLNNSSFQSSEEEIEPKKILNIVLRNKSIVAFFTIFLCVFSIIYAFSKKKIYQGNFQIVVKEKRDKDFAESSIVGRSSLLENLTGKSSNLKTQVGILQSSSVLLPVFEFYKKEKYQSNPNLKEISFPSWKNNMELTLKKSTDIVDITYQDDNKSLIKKVLDKTIKTYQEYSGKGKKRNLELADKYLREQISFYKNKSSQSIKAVQQYAIDQDLTMLDYGFLNYSSSDDFTTDLMGAGGGLSPFISNIQSQSGDVLGKNVNIEIARAKAANQIRNIDIKIRKIQSLEENDGIDELSYINLTIPKLDGNDTINDLTKLDLQILELKSKYTDKFPELERLYEKRKLLIELLKDKSIGLLKAQKVSAESVLEAATRPKGVLLKYKELVRQANRDDKTLVRLENRLGGIKLQQARYEDPWEIITSPTIQGPPVAPNKKLITLIGTIFGFIFGFFIAFLKEKKSGLIFEHDILESLFKIRIIDNIDLNKLNPKSFDNKFFIKEIFKRNKDKSFKFLYSNYLYKLDPQSLRLLFEESKTSSSIIGDLEDIQDNQIIILVTTIPNITFKEANRIKTQLEIIGKELYGIVIVKE